MTEKMTEKMTEESFDQRAESLPESSLPESMWQMKPWWCQPWSIVLTGIAIPVGSWLLLHRLWITLPVVGAIALWWLLFLVVVPMQYAAAIREGTDTNLSI